MSDQTLLAIGCAIGLVLGCVMIAAAKIIERCGQ